MPRAFRVSKAGAVAGFLGEGPGPFVFSSDAAGAFPVLKHARFNSASEALEDDIGVILEADLDFDHSCSRIEGAGFVLEPVEYASVFEPAKDAPIAGPSFEHYGSEDIESERG